MERISSSLTFMNKQVFPVFWFGMLGLMTALFLFAHGPKSPPRALVVVPLGMMAFGYVLMRKLVLDLVDEVFDAGSELVVRNLGLEARVPLSEIVNIDQSMFTRPERVTLTLRQPTVVGRVITFMPPLRFFPFGRHPVVEDLIERVARVTARGAAE